MITSKTTITASIHIAEGEVSTTNHGEFCTIDLGEQFTRATLFIGTPELADEIIEAATQVKKDLLQFNEDQLTLDIDA